MDYIPLKSIPGKKQLTEQASELFSRGNSSKKEKGDVDNLHRVIGQLTVERDFLVRKLDH